MTGGHGLERARRLLALPGAWIESAADGYALRTGHDRRARVMLALTEADFRALAIEPGLKTRARGGWMARRPATVAGPAGEAGRPGIIEGIRVLMQPDGEATSHRANLAGSPIAWLAGRADALGAPWLSRAEIAAAELLARDAEAALRGTAVTMRWDALPRARSGGGRRAEPGDAALAAARRVETALTACGPARAMVSAVCLQSTPLQAAEQTLGLRRRTGKALLRQGLVALAAHYRLT